jgi:hypothetical protein
VMPDYQIPRPVRERICEGCGREVQRNLALFDGKPYHFGCLKKTRGRPTHQCLDCGSFLTRRGIVTTYIGGGVKVRSCVHCGSPMLKPLHRRPWLR